MTLTWSDNQFTMGDNLQILEIRSEELNAERITSNKIRFRVAYKAIPARKNKFTMVYRWRKCSAQRHFDAASRRR
jgi:hypothetical protein